jgi:DNA helicase II / ATP-dependent DNA helicase PcrA
MRIVYNPDTLFTGIPKENQLPLYERIFDFVKAVDASHNGITPSIIQKYSLKKMRGANNIFKFYLNSDGMRCLFKYEESDHQIFEGEPGIVLLRAVYHDEQGRIGKQLDNDLIDLENYVTFDIENDAIADINIDPILGRQYMRNVLLPPDISIRELTERFKQDDGRVIYKLSSSQYDCLSSEEPVFLLGCAGSGKTLVEVCKALKNAHTPLKQAYFTFTPMLREVAEEIYKKYEHSSGIEGQTTFYCLKDYMLQMLNIPESRYFSFERFKNWYSKANFDRNLKWIRDVGPINLWTEIRGMIKGYVGNEYYRMTEIPQIDAYLNDLEIQDLESRNVIRRLKGFQKSYTISDEPIFRDYLLKNHPTFQQLLEARDFQEPLLDATTYLEKINIKYSQYDAKDRKQILDFVRTTYQNHLTNSQDSWYDDNDLARMFIEQLRNRKIERLDYVFVDELQDLTEMQILALTMLAEHPKRVFMSGDVSQIINPTFFKLGRIGVIFRNRFGVTLNKESKLNENYRNSESIVRISRELLEIRQSTLGVYSEDIKEESKELEKREGLPFVIDCSINEFIPIMGTWLSVPKVAIIVASNETKKELERKLQIKSQTNIYTVQEVKGQEFDKIITYNIISEHESEWNEIMSGSIDKGSDLVNRYRYFFNLLYVAITRGKNNLFLFETNRDSAIMKHIAHLFEWISENLENVMNLKEYQTEEYRREQALSHFKNEDYDRARTFYLQLDDKRMASICAGNAYIKKGRYYEGVSHLYQFEEYYQKAFPYASVKELPLFRWIMGWKTKMLDIDVIAREADGKSLVKMARVFRDKSIFPTLMKDAIELITKINEYLAKQQFNLIKLKEKYHGKR